ncbi:MAG: DUF4349 domain-containing protein [Bacteroidales bacterium]|nr:DUF4349 domain-containing protein [Bacteroidales bacterium]
MSSQASEPASDERMMAYSASLELSVKDNEETRKLLIELMRSSGGFIVNETESSIRTRIPSQNMDIFLAEARTFGNVENESKSGADITDQYRDNVARLNGLKNVRDRYLALLEQANTVSDILSIERELERVNTNIDILEGRIRHAESSVAYSIVTVKFREKTKLGPVGWIFYGLYRGVKWLFVWS